MKTIFTLLFLAVFTLGIKAQTQFQLPVTFENPEEDTVWNVFANAGDPEPAENFNLVENPVFNGINTSEFCIEFIVVDAAAQWAGAWSDAYGVMEITEENHIMEMMVLKDKISPCGLKVEGDGDALELKVPNTVIGEWELISFDFSNAIGKNHPRLVFFPDFPDEARTSGGTSYVDNIGFHVEPTSVDRDRLSGISVYPNPAAERITVQYPEMGRVTISNMLGQSVKSLVFRNSDREIIELKDLNPGIYFLSVETAGGLVSSKFVKE